MAQAKETAKYTHGHHSSVVNDHARRRATDSAAFLLPHIKPHFEILDVGCGPGTITADLADLVPDGHVTGLDSVSSVLDQARSFAESRGLTKERLTFQHHDANALPFPDGTFDVVFCHQVLQHVGAPVAVLKEMRRVAKPGGIVAAREADYASFAWYPEPPLLDRWRELYGVVMKANGGEPNAGRYVHVWAKQAGFAQQEIETTWHAWRYGGVRAQQFASSWHGRALQPGFMGTAVKEGLATEDEVKQISEAWAEWGRHEDAFVGIPNGEILCRKSN